MTEEDKKFRDEIAKSMLVALTPTYWDTSSDYESGSLLVKCHVESAYEYADEMLKARNKHNQQVD